MDNEPLVDPFQLIHDCGFSWDDVNAIAATLDAAGFDVVLDAERARQADRLEVVINGGIAVSTEPERAGRHEDEYDALARQLHESIAEGQSVALTAKALRLLDAERARQAGPVGLRTHLHIFFGLEHLGDCLGTDHRTEDDALCAKAERWMLASRPAQPVEQGPLREARHPFTCGICDWGRSPENHDHKAYLDHLASVHAGRNA